MMSSLHGTSTDDEAFQVFSDSKKIHKDGAFNLRTNSQSLQSGNLPSPSLEETYTDATLGKPHTSKSLTVKVLGGIWDPQGDHLSVSVTAEATAIAEPTKNVSLANFMTH